MRVTAAVSLWQQPSAIRYTPIRCVTLAVCNCSRYELHETNAMCVVCGRVIRMTMIPIRWQSAACGSIHI